jgi:hypothetical protein
MVGHEQSLTRAPQSGRSIDALVLVPGSQDRMIAGLGCMTSNQELRKADVRVEDCFLVGGCGALLRCMARRPRALPQAGE